MKLQRWSLYRGSLEPTSNGGWVKYEDAKSIIDSMKCCGNCKHDIDADEENCAGCCEPKLEKWEMG
jgi:hypothetical protein